MFECLIRKEEESGIPCNQEGEREAVAGKVTVPASPQSAVP